MPDLTAHFVDEAHSVFEQVQELARACPDELKDDGADTESDEWLDSGK